MRILWRRTSNENCSRLLTKRQCERRRTTVRGLTLRRRFSLLEGRTLQLQSAQHRWDNVGFQPKQLRFAAYWECPPGQFPPKVPATEKLFPFPQPLGVSYGHGSVGVGAGEREPWELRAGGDEGTAHSGVCRVVGPRNLQAAAGAGRARRGNFRDPDHPRTLRPCCRTATAVSNTHL